jgi:predicted nucleic-acid-binding Zn-ribbon protein
MHNAFKYRFPECGHEITAKWHEFISRECKKCGYFPIRMFDAVYVEETSKDDNKGYT